MISLKKLLEQSHVGAVPIAEPLPTQEVAPGVESEEWLKAWRALTFAVCDSTERAIPPLGPALKQKLSALGRTFFSEPTEESLSNVNHAMCQELAQWSGEASRFYGEHQRELMEIMAVVARTAEVMAQRDDRYSQEIGGFATRLRSVAEESDIAAIRRSILESAGAMQTCVTRMAREGEETVRQLSAKIDEYRNRMQKAERISLVDPLTAVANRRGLERDLALRMQQGKRFSVIVMDLNEFKSLNDRYGHAAGDDLLRQFASELGTQFPAHDLVARLGGDEFVGVVTGHANEAEARTGRLRTWVMGNYRVSDAQDKKIEVKINASLGAASWDGKESSESLLARADAKMYEAKRESKAQQGSAAVQEPPPLRNLHKI